MRTSYTLPRLIICEGPSDIAFLQRLTNLVDPNKHWHIESTSKERGQRGGKGLLKQKLFSLSGTTGFDKVSDILIVADNDEDQTESFAEVCECIVGAELGPAPGGLLTPSTGQPRVTVMLLPLTGQPGALEDELEVAARKHADWRARRAADQSMTTLSSGAWRAARKSKAWLRIFLAGACDRNPFVTLSTALRDPRNEVLIDLADACFQPIRDELAKVP